MSALTSVEEYYQAELIKLQEQFNSLSAAYHILANDHARVTQERDQTQAYITGTPQNLDRWDPVYIMGERDSERAEKKFYNGLFRKECDKNARLRYVANKVIEVAKDTPVVQDSALEGEIKEMEELLQKENK